MPLILAIGAGYAYYKKKKGVDVDNNGSNTKKITKIDPVIKLKGKTALTLHMFEKEMCMLELPIATVSFYHGNYEDVTVALKTRVEAIILSNPWLMGRLLPMPDVKILYDPIGVDRPPSYFTIYEPGCLLLNDVTPYTCYNSILKTAMVLPNSELIGQNKPLWKVSIIPDETEPTNKFALVVSMSHLLGDAHTYYTIYNMLSVENSQNIESLNPVRVFNYEESIRQFFGASETNYVNELLSANNIPSVDEAPITPSINVPNQFLDQSLKSTSNISDTDNANLSGSSHQLENSTSGMTDVLGVEKYTKTFQASCPPLDATSSSVSTEEMDTSFDSKSTYDSESNDSLRKELTTTPSNSSLSLLESFVQLQTRTQAKTNVVKMFYINEEWIATQKKVQLSDTISTNSIISSWFFQINDASFGLIMMNLRSRLPTVTSVESGNYVHALVFSENEFQKAESIHEKIKGLGNMEKEFVQPAIHFDMDKKASISVNWTNFNRNELFLSELCQHKFHIPIYDTKIMQYLPEKVSAINLFTVNTSQCIDSQQCRIGAFIVCQEACWKRIEQSGIILELIPCVES